MPLAAAWQQAMSTFSSMRESILEHRFLADVGAELWRRGVFDFAVSHSEVDNSGYDVILEASDVVRHVQLKSLHLDGQTDDFPIQSRLEAKPPACVIVIRHHGETLQVEDYLWFGSPPGEPIPALGDIAVRHTKPNGLGVKAERPAHRTLKLNRFVTSGSVSGLVNRLFGATPPH